MLSVRRSRSDCPARESLYDCPDVVSARVCPRLPLLQCYIHLIYNITIHSSSFLSSGLLPLAAILENSSRSSPLGHCPLVVIPQGCPLRPPFSSLARPSGGGSSKSWLEIHPLAALFRVGTSFLIVGPLPPAVILRCPPLGLCCWFF